MEKGEPTLVPEWLRSAGSVTGGVSSTHHFASSSHPDVPSLAYPTRNSSFKSIGDFDSPRSAVLERSASSNSRRNSSSNGSSKHPYSSFGRSHRDKERDRDKERSVGGDHWDFDPLGKMLPRRAVDDTLRHSRSMVSRKQGDFLPRRVATDSRNGTGSNHHNGNGMLSGGSVGSGIQKTVFDKDFPSLGTEERQGSPDIGRVPSPGLTSAIQSLPISNSALMGGEGWSALAEVPMVIGSNSMGPQLVHQSAAAATVTPASGVPGSMTGLNMAEALAQAPSRSRSAPLVSVETQRLEELAIRKSKQLIPMTPSMPKALIINSSDKLKPKATVRSGEMIGATKSGQQPPSLHPASQSLRGGLVKSEAPKTTHAGKFLVLKSVRENGVSQASKDVTSPTNNTSNRVASFQLAVPLVASGPMSPNNPKLPIVERKTAPLPLNLGPVAEKRPLSQARSRSDFFNLMRKKTLMNTSAVLPDSGSVITSPTMEKSGEVIKEVTSEPVSPHVIENGEVASNGDASEEAKRFSDNGEKDLFPNAADYPDEEEVAFLRSLGWDENAGEDEGITEEEINAFYQECLKMGRGMQPKLSMLSQSHATNMGVAEVSPSGSESEA